MEISNCESARSRSRFASFQHRKCQQDDFKISSMSLIEAVRVLMKKRLDLSLFNVKFVYCFGGRLDGVQRHVRPGPLPKSDL